MAQKLGNVYIFYNFVNVYRTQNDKGGVSVVNMQTVVGKSRGGGGMESR